MSDTDGDGRTFFLQVYPRLAGGVGPCCTMRVSQETTAAAVICGVVEALGADQSASYVLAEVQDMGDKEWLLEPTDLPAERIQLWPWKVQERHLQGDGYYFLLRECTNDGSVCFSAGEGGRGGEVGESRAEARRLMTRGFLPPDRKDVDDLCDLPVLSEDAILTALHARFLREKIYTYAGSILVAINPFRFLPIYNPKYVKRYEGRPLGEQEPHVFAVADVAYRAMLRCRRNQCVLISGESGSGKTQSTNFLIHCLTALSQKGYASGVERTILGAGPVLEAFGNAKTAYNDNSSRFGKYIQLNYLESGMVRGAVVEKYLLEKSRLVSRGKNERNYHVFYYLLAGASEDDRREFELLNPEEYVYLKQESTFTGYEAELRHEFERLQQAMEMVGFLPPTKRQIFAMLSAILYLGNVTYSPKGLDRDEGLEVGPPKVLKILSDLLQVKQELLVKALTQRKSVTANDTLILPYSTAEAITARDSMAKSLYSALFDWIVLRINHALLNKKDLEDSVTRLSIGVLDIFGFEDFENNSFEQFCINYTNEQLQYYFNQHIFKLEQEEYQAEGISWSNINYTDNVGCINLISKKPTGLFYLLDEESNFPHATDKTLLTKFKQQHQGNPYFVPTPVLEPAFIVQHFAGNVKYQLKDFREKNTDHMRADIVSLLRSSDRAYIRQLIATSPGAAFRWGVLRAAIHSLAVFNEAARRQAAKTTDLLWQHSRTMLGELRTPRKLLERMYSQKPLVEFSFDQSVEHPLEAFEDIFASFENKKSSRATRQKQIIPKNLINPSSLKMIVSLTMHDRSTWALLHLNKKKKPPSIGAQFQASLNKLMESLRRTDPFFIHCIRSNANKMEMCFDEALVLQQLRYMGMLETVRIRRSGYSAKYTFQEFARYFRVLLPKAMTSPQRDIASLLQMMGFGPNTYQIGRTKVFLKEPERQKLQDALHQEVLDKIVFLQRCFRAHLERRHFLYMRCAAITIQRHWRAYYEEKHYQAAVMIQAMWRGSQERVQYLRQQESFLKMQLLARSRLGQQRFQQKQDEDEAPGLGEAEQGTTGKRQSEKRVEIKEVEFLGGGGLETSTPEGNLEADMGRTSEKRETPKIPSGSSTGLGGKAMGVQPDESPSVPPKGKEEATGQEIRFPSIQDRPTSLPLDLVTGYEEEPPMGPTLQRYNKYTLLKDKAEKWKERRSDSVFQDVGSQAQNPAGRRERGSLTRRISVSLDDVSSLAPSTMDSVQKVRLHYRKRRLAHVRSVLKNEDVGDPEYWSFPLPPMSPGQPLGVDSPDRQPQPPVEITPDGSKFSSQKPGSREGQEAAGHQTPTTQEKSGFFRKILKRRPHKEAPASDNGEVIVPPSRPNNVRLQVRQNSSIKISRATRVSMQWNASLDREITSGHELRHLDDFLANQVNDLRSCGKTLSATEILFIKATMEFRENIKGMYSLQNPCIRCRYKDLMTSYQSKVTTLGTQKQKTEVPLVVNLFQSVLDGFVRAAIKRNEMEPEKPAKKKARKKDNVREHRLDHVLSTYQVNIIQSCDPCASYIWGMDKALICSGCKMVCHKKCLSKIMKHCSTYVPRKDVEACGSQNFGVHVRFLIDETHMVPIVMAMLLEHVELNGLYTEGIYRKSGAVNRMRELHQRLEKDPQAVCLEEYPIHTISGLLKQWLRELPEPLMTFTHYRDFLHAVELPEKSEQLKAIYTVLDQLPPANFNTLERLIFHLVRVAREEAYNRMSPSSLAIVFAPCLLRNPDTLNLLDGMMDVSKTTMCLEILLNEQMRLYKEKLKELEQLEYAEALAMKQLKLRRENTLTPPTKQVTIPECESSDSDMVLNKILERIKSIKQEKDELACTLPELNPSSLDQESMETESPLEDRLWSLSHERVAVPMMTPAPCQPLVEPSTDPCSTLLEPPKQFQDPKNQNNTLPDERRWEQPPGQSPKSTPKTPVAHKQLASAQVPLQSLNIPYIDDNL